MMSVQEETQSVEENTERFESDVEAIDVDRAEMEAAFSDPDMDYLDHEDLMDIPRFWSLKIEAGEDQILRSHFNIPGYVLHVTAAAFGVEDYDIDTRTVLLLQQGPECEPASLCVLNNNKQHAALNLIINEPVKFMVKGQKPCAVHLTGYLKSMENDEDSVHLSDMDYSKMDFDDFSDDVMDNDVEEEEQEQDQEEEEEDESKDTVDEKTQDVE